MPSKLCVKSERLLRLNLNVHREFLLLALKRAGHSREAIYAKVRMSASALNYYVELVFSAADAPQGAE